MSSTLGPNRRRKSKLGLFTRGKKHCFSVEKRVWSFETGAGREPGEKLGSHEQRFSLNPLIPLLPMDPDHLTDHLRLWESKDFVL